MRNTTQKIAEAFPPGQFIRDELEARGWSQRDLAKIIGRPLQAVNEIINGRKRITAETSLALSAAFGTEPKLWMNLEASYRIWLAGAPDPRIAKRAAAMMRG
jgi:HTH-type transcriptional regulator/antitoxin HigA